MSKMDDCKNRFNQSKCDPWIIEKFEVHREILIPNDNDIVDYTQPLDDPGKTDAICNNCKYFDR